MKRKLSDIECSSKAMHGEIVSRYSRQMLIPQIGIEGQYAISSTSVVIIGGITKKCVILAHFNSIS